MANIPSKHREPHGEEEKRRTPTAEPREPQLNRTICGCECGVRGCIQGDQGSDGSESGGGENTDFLAGEEGVNKQSPPDPDQQKHTPAVPYWIDTMLASCHAEYERGRRGFEYGTTAVVHELPFRSLTPLRRINSTDSLYMQLSSSGEMSMASSLSFSRSPTSHEDLVSIGAWVPMYGYQEDYDMDGADDEDSSC